MKQYALPILLFVLGNISPSYGAEQLFSDKAAPCSNADLYRQANSFAATMKILTNSCIEAQEKFFEANKNNVINSSLEFKGNIVQNWAILNDTYTLSIAKVDFAELQRRVNTLSEDVRQIKPTCLSTIFCCLQPKFADSFSRIKEDLRSLTPEGISQVWTSQYFTTTEELYGKPTSLTAQGFIPYIQFPLIPDFLDESKSIGRDLQGMFSQNLTSCVSVSLTLDTPSKRQATIGYSYGTAGNLRTADIIISGDPTAMFAARSKLLEFLKRSIETKKYQ